MIIPSAIRLQLGFDPESALFLDSFDEPVGSKILEVGAHDSPLAKMMAETGFRVVSVDLRPYDHGTHPYHKHIIGDFCNLPKEFWQEHRETFDCAFSVSALEHFGLGTYGEKKAFNYDVIAVRYIWDLLKEGGSFYLTVPFGSRFVEKTPDWRVYDFPNLMERLIQDFSMEKFGVANCDTYKSMGREVKAGEPVTLLDVLINHNGSPCISAFLKLRKMSVKREAK